MVLTRYEGALTAKLISHPHGALAFLKIRLARAHPITHRNTFSFHPEYGGYWMPGSGNAEALAKPL